MRRLRLTAIILAALLAGLTAGQPVFAADTEIVFKNDNQAAVIEFSSDDLFAKFKGVMPGQSLSQQIILRNETSHPLRIFIKGKPIGAAERAFLQLASLEGTINGHLVFDYRTPATDLSSEVVLAVLPAQASSVMEVVLSTPLDLSNEYQSTSYTYVWILRAVDDLIAGGSDNPPSTGVHFRYLLLPSVFVLLGAIFLFIPWKRRRREEP